MITYNYEDPKNIPVYLDGIKIGIIIRTSFGKWQYLPGGSKKHAGKEYNSLQGLQRDLEAE